MRVRGIYYLFLATAVAIMSGCGGGAMVKAPVAPTHAIVKVRTSGPLPSGTTIGGIYAFVTYPTTKGLSITESNVVASGSGGASGSLFAANVITIPGQVHLILITTNGIQAGEFATLTFSIAAGNSPVESDFAIASGARVIDTNPIPGMTVEIQGVTFH
jgi:hypothetical protein